MLHGALHTSNTRFALALRFIDAMLVTRDLQRGTSDFAKRVGADGADLIRDTHFKLKSCIINGGEATAEEYNAHLEAKAKSRKAISERLPKPYLGQYLYNLK